MGVSAGYTYDGLGRQTKIPAIDAPRTNTSASATGDITIGYYADDAARSITRNGITTTIERDPAGRRLNLIGTGTGNAGNETKHYADDSDNPAWSTRTLGSTTTTTRYESTIGGNLALTISNYQVELAVNNPHGDTVTTIPLTGTGAGQGIEGWAQYDEYGNQLTDSVDTGATAYGWHGADQRALDTSGLILMGARLYNSVTGLFTSRDPVDGGNSTTYAYPQDPIGMNDITGLWSWGATATVLGIGAMFLSGPVGWAVFGASAAINVAIGYKRIRAGDRGGWWNIGTAAFGGVGRGLKVVGSAWARKGTKKAITRLTKWKPQRVQIRKWNRRVTWPYRAANAGYAGMNYRVNAWPKHKPYVKRYVNSVRPYYIRGYGQRR